MLGRLDQLVLADFAQELQRQNKFQGLETLKLILEELKAPFKDPRPPYEPLQCVAPADRFGSEERCAV